MLSSTRRRQQQRHCPHSCLSDRVEEERQPSRHWYDPLPLNLSPLPHDYPSSSRAVEPTAHTHQAERNTTTQTHTSTTPLSVSALLPGPYIPASSHYRSAGDPAFERSRRFLLLDTPGHGKVRHYANSTLVEPKNIRAIIFVVDAAALAEENGLNEAAEYLHDILLSLQKRYTGATSSKGPKEIPVLVAANKMDLFTALPANLVKSLLEKGITEIRANRAKALRDAGAALAGNEDEVDEEKEWLGEGGEGAFNFEMMKESGISVDVLGGNVVSGKEVGDVQKWWEWVAEHL
jgi:signal recognition particle receptor subunit beta